MYLIAGLGNPGSKYFNTRHNVGFMIIDYLASLYMINIKTSEANALTGRGIIQGKEVMLVKPQTFMNNSGVSIKELSEKYSIDNDKIIIIYDDMDIETGKIRIRPKGSAGTHNGMRSILYHLGYENFPRIRIGIGKPENTSIIDYVLGRFNDREIEIISEVLKKTAYAISTFLAADCMLAMSKYNG